MNLSSLVHNLGYRLERLPPWPCAAAGIAAGIGLAWLFLLRIGGLQGVVAYGVLLSLALWVGFRARPVVDIQARDGLSAGAMSALQVSRAESAKTPVPALLPMVLINAGSFRMGSSRDDAGAFDNEFPQHVVTLSGFEMARFAVPRGVYRTVMDESPPEWGEDFEPDVPANHVDWFQAVAFCNVLSEREGLKPCYRIDGQSVVWDRSANGYRLPTEAEWEYVAPAGTQSVYFFGDDAAALGEYAWYSENGEYEIHPVGKRVANPWGLHELPGNVWEWCWDWYGPYSPDLETDPVGPAGGEWRMLRGGSARGGARGLRSARRRSYWPKSRDGGVGFRCVRAPAASLDD